MAGVLCNDSRLVHADERWTVQGDPTEGALLTVAAKAGMDRQRLQAEAPRVDSIPFESLHQYGRRRMTWAKDGRWPST